MKILKYLIYFFMLFFTTIVFGKDFNNGCGSGWNEPIVPDSIKNTCVDFTTSCANHDNCYSKCLKDGENYNTPICKTSSEEEKENRRYNCDDTFLNDMLEICNKCGPSSHFVCNRVAKLYAFGVRIGGSGSFDGREIPKEYYEFLASDKAKVFDFDGFEKDWMEVLRIQGIEKKNIFKIEMKDGVPKTAIKSVKPSKTILKTIKSETKLNFDKLKNVQSNKKAP